MSSKTDKKELIIKAAMKVFSKNGFHKAKMQNIADEAGIGKGTLYEYFDSKKMLFSEMIRVMLDEYIQKAKATINKDLSFEEILGAYIKFQGEQMDNHIGMAQSFVNQSNGIPEEMKCWRFKVRNDLLGVMRDVFSNASQNGEIRKGIDVQIAVQCIFGSVNQFYLDKYFIEGKSLDEIDTKPLIDILLRGIGA